MHYVVSVPVDENLAGFIGKKGSEDGLVFYNRKVEDNTIVAIMPANKEGSMHYNIAESMLIAGQMAISTASVDRLLGEVIVAASLLKKHVLLTDDNDVSGMVKDLLKDYEVCSRDVLLSRITSEKGQHDGELRIDIDKAFPVKGIGTVLLGVVTRGTVRVHDQLHHSSGKQVLIKSIQSQDVDVQEAGYGCRVGLAVKGIEHDEVDKGDLLCAKPFHKAKAMDAVLVSSPFSKEKAAQGSRYLAVSNFSRSVCKIDAVDGQNARISLEKPLSVLLGDTFVLIAESSPRIFASGTVTATV